MGELVAEAGKRLKSYNKVDERVPMAKTTLADKLAKVVQRKAKAEQDEARLKDRQRVERTHQLTELGGLIAKAGIDGLPPRALYACFLRIAEEAKDKSKVALWEREGGRHFQVDDDAREIAIARFPDKLAAEPAAALRNLGFRWNRLLGQWEGNVLYADAEKAVTVAGGAISKPAPRTGPSA
jgi:hypothetical protein